MKYRYAKQWGIHCVTAKWFHDSVEAGYSMTEGDYDIDREPGEAGEGDNGTSRKRYVTINHLIRSCIPSYNIIYITCMYVVGVGSTCMLMVQIEFFSPMYNIFIICHLCHSYTLYVCSN